MTIGEIVKEAVDTLPKTMQLQALTYILGLKKSEPSPKLIRLKRTTAEKTQPVVSELDAAINDAAGIWKNRTDLPKNSVAASRVLRRRLMRRSGNA